MREVKLKIYGKVQGVFYRASTKNKANELGIKGWVKNESDGSVTVLAQGNEDQLLKLIEWCKVGPDFARVKKVVETWDEPEEKFSNFNIIG